MMRGGFPGVSVFDLTLAIAEADRARALRILGRNLEAGEAPLRILGSLIWQYRRIWKARDLVEEGRSDAELARALAISPYRLRDLLAQARRFSTAHLRHAFDLLLKADSDLKGGSGGTAGRVLEGLLLELCGEFKTAPASGSLRPQALSPLAERKGGTPISNVRTIRSGKSPAR
jgi:DNA polymerase-3 subunit delta